MLLAALVAFFVKNRLVNARAELRVKERPDDDMDTSVTYGAVLYLPDLALDADLPSGAWLIGHKCALKATGGEDK